MCNLTTKTRKKTVVVYKLVYEIDGNYYACLSGVKIELGKVKPQTDEDWHNIKNQPRCIWRSYTPSSGFFDKNMIGKTSGFADKRIAEVAYFQLYGCRMLKITLGGEIWMGDASGISYHISEDEVIYAGTEILAFELVSAISGRNKFDTVRKLKHNFCNK